MPGRLFSHSSEDRRRWLKTSIAGGRNEMKLHVVRIMICVLFLFPLITINAAAEPKLDIIIAGGIGVQATIKNTGDEAAGTQAPQNLSGVQPVIVAGHSNYEQ